MFIDKSFSKGDLVDLINDLDLPIIHSHQDNKKTIQAKFQEAMTKQIEIKTNFYNIVNKDGLMIYLENTNPKKTLNIKEKKNVMLICKHIIEYCKNNYDLNLTKYDTMKDLIDDVDYIKQFGDIPSVRRCCRLLNDDIKCSGIKFNPLISPQAQKELDQKKSMKKTPSYTMTIRRATKDNPIILYFD
tara:strand:- start:351 stop:911 length:561 start_codon:yes stop_codon:yes gene_type:complete